MRPPFLLCSWLVRARASNGRFATRFPVSPPSRRTPRKRAAVVERESESQSWRRVRDLERERVRESAPAIGNESESAHSPVSHSTARAHGAMSCELCSSCESPKWNRFRASTTIGPAPDSRQPRLQQIVHVSRSALPVARSASRFETRQI